MNVPLTLAGIAIGAIGFLVRREDRARARLGALVADAPTISIARALVGAPIAIAGRVTECRKNSLTVEDAEGSRALVDLATARIFVKDGDAFRLGDEVTIFGAPRFESHSEDEHARRILFFAALDDAMPLVANVAKRDLQTKLAGRGFGIWLVALGALLVLIASFRR